MKIHTNEQQFWLHYSEMREGLSFREKVANCFLVFEEVVSRLEALKKRLPPRMVFDMGGPDLDAMNTALGIVNLTSRDVAAEQNMWFHFEEMLKGLGETQQVAELQKVLIEMNEIRKRDVVKAYDEVCSETAHDWSGSEETSSDEDGALFE